MKTTDMTDDQRERRKQQFLTALRKLLHKTVGTQVFTDADPLLLLQLQESTSLYQPWMWPK